MMKAAVLLCLINCFLPSLTAELRQAPVTAQQWEYLLLAQFWPGTSCVYFRDHGCTVPPGVDGWTIHGLWPSRNSSHQPEFCNNTMKFDYSQIQVLRSQLDQYWPYFDKTGDPASLWQHEWEKHGTCAYSLPLLQGELKYFSAAINLYRQLNIYDTLSKAGVVPAQDKQYNLNQVFNALRNTYQITPQIECYFANNKHYLDQVWLCYDKTLRLTDCPQAHVSRIQRSSTSGVRRSGPYLQFESEKPVKNISVQPVREKSYYVDCPADGLVYYIPKP